MMNNTYIIRKKSLNEALDLTSSLEERMVRFLSRHDNVEYHLNIDNEKDDWIITINIKNKDEQINTQTSKEIIGSRSVL